MALKILFILLMWGFFQENNGFKGNFEVHVPIGSNFISTQTAAKLHQAGYKEQKTEESMVSLQSQLTSVLQRLDKMEEEANKKRLSHEDRISSMEKEQVELNAKLDVAADKSSRSVAIMKSVEHETGEKVANMASTVKDLESKSEKAEEHIGQLTNRLSTAEAKASMWSSCSDDADCLVERSLCINDVCVCDPGLAYHPKKNKCVDSCTTYGQHYTTYRGYYIGGHNTKNYYHISEKKCKDACTATTPFVCRSADHRTRDGLCSLTHETLKTVPKSDYHVESNITIITHFSRNCLT